MERANVIGMIIAVSQSTRRIFAIFEPTTFPIDISVFHWIAATTETISSGAEVPMATTVSPISISDNQNFLAIPDAPSTKKFAPYARMPSHQNIEMSAINKSIRKNARRI